MSEKYLRGEKKKKKNIKIKKKNHINSKYKPRRACRLNYNRRIRIIIARNPATMHHVNRTNADERNKNWNGSAPRNGLFLIKLSLLINSNGIVLYIGSEFRKCCNKTEGFLQQNKYKANQMTKRPIKRCPIKCNKRASIKAVIELES